jgi:hypothetical protein
MAPNISESVPLWNQFSELILKEYQEFVKICDLAQKLHLPDQNLFKKL